MNLRLLFALAALHAVARAQKKALGALWSSGNTEAHHWLTQNELLRKKRFTWSWLALDKWPAKCVHV